MSTHQQCILSFFISIANTDRLGNGLRPPCVSRAPPRFRFASSRCRASLDPPRVSRASPRFRFASSRCRASPDPPRLSRAFPRLTSRERASPYKSKIIKAHPKT